MKQAYLLLGEIVRPQGIRGEVKVRHFTDDPGRFRELEQLWKKTPSGYEPLRVVSARVQGEDVFLTLEGVTDRNQAEGLRGTQLWVDHDHARELGEDEVFIADILGAKAYDTQGQEIGTLEDVEHTSTDVFVFSTPKGTLRVPFLRDVMLSIDPEEGKILLEEKRLDEVGLYEDSRS